MKGTLDARRVQALQRLSTILDVHFNDIALLHQALTHTSFANESKIMNMQHNERVEFLGDAVLDLIISDYLYKRFPNLPEGELTKARAVIVCEASLARRASQLGVGEYLLLGKGESLSGGRTRASILADSFEAILGAIYLDNGIQVATSFVLAQLREQLESVERGHYVRDYKTLLQEVIQKDTANTLHYPSSVISVVPMHRRAGACAGPVRPLHLGAARQYAAAGLRCPRRLPASSVG
jgi:ribonuclease-3